jgi:hypothetical protein
MSHLQVRTHLAHKLFNSETYSQSTVILERHDKQNILQCSYAVNVKIYIIMPQIQSENLSGNMNTNAWYHIL